MFDLKLNSGGDLHIGAEGDVATTGSVVQAVKIRLKWVLGEWRLSPALGFPYYEEVFVKNPNLVKIKSFLRDLIMQVDGVTDVASVEIETDAKTRKAKFTVVFVVGEETFKEEVITNG